METVHYGPWVGEFGFELIWWSPAVRAAARVDHEAGRRVVVSAPATSEWLYEFADEFVPLMGKHVPVEADRHIGWLDLPSICRPRGSAGHIGGGRQAAPLPWEHRFLGGEPDRSAPDVMIAFRPEKHRAGKAYPPDMCAALVSELESRGFSVGCFGGPDNWHFGSGPDFRGAPLRRQCALLAATRCAAGPSSGTMHLASLCRTPYVTWYATTTKQSRQSRKIHKETWNPFGTEVTFLRKMPPSHTEVADAVKALVQRRQKPVLIARTKSRPKMTRAQRRCRRHKR